MLRVLDEQASLDFYQKALGFKLKQVRDFASFKLIYLQDPGSAFEIELTINKDKTEPYELGNGYGHVAFVTDDLKALHDKVTGLGYKANDIKRFEPDGEFVAEFFFMKDPDGYDIEVIARSERYN